MAGVWVFVYIFSCAVAYLCVTPLINFVRFVSMQSTVALVANIRLFLCLSYIVVNQWFTIFLWMPCCRQACHKACFAWRNGLYCIAVWLLLHADGVHSGVSKSLSYAADESLRLCDSIVMRFLYPLKTVCVSIYQNSFIRIF